MEIQRFGPEHVAGAARLFAALHHRRRSSCPLLSTQHEDPGVTERLLTDRLAEGAEGAVVVDAASVRAYVLALPGNNDHLGRHVWIGPESHAYSGDPEVLRHLYAALAGRWIEQGRGHHFAVVPCIEDEGVDRWLHLAFAHEQVHALRAVEDPPPSPSSRWRPRPAEPADVPRLAPLMPLIGRAHEVAPTLAYVEPGFYERIEEGHAELIEDPDVGYFLVEDRARMLGFAVMRPVADGEATWLKPRGAVELVIAATVPDARGRGVMRALMRACFAWAAERSFTTCVTDWRATNLGSSTVWPRLGFRPIAYRLHRIVDPRLLSTST